MHCRVVAGLTLGLIALIGTSACVTQSPPRPAWNYFAPMPKGDVFGPAVLVWQGARMIEDERGREFDHSASPLAADYAAFSADLRRQIVERTVKWVQQNSGLYFLEDGEIDHWPTLPEVLERGEDDCDGMDVMTFELLRSAGFGPGEIYRAVLVHDETQLHHMVTLWFPRDDPQDPYVLDPTGDVTPLVRRLSEVTNRWTPLVLFDETQRFRVSPSVLVPSG